MWLHVALFLGGLAPCSASRKPYQRTTALADRAWESVTRGNFSALPRAYALYAQAFSESGSTLYDLYWESIRVATVGCLHALLPTPEALHAALDGELRLDPSRTGVSQMVAMAHFSGEAMFRVARTWGPAFDEAGAGAAAAPPHPAAARPLWPAAGRRARIGVLTGHWGDHPVGHHIGGWLRNVDVGTWEVLCFSGAITPAGDADVSRNAELCGAAAGGGGGISVLPPGAAEGARALAAAGLDVLLTLDGYDRGHRAATLAALARLPGAPSTVGWFGYLGTLGAAYVPGLLGDGASTPESDELLFTEAAILRHPSTFFVSDYAALHPGVPAAPPFAPPPRGGANFTFCCFSQLWKVRPAVFAAWLSVLQRAPAATLLLMEHPPVARAGLEATYGAHPAWPRVAFLPLLPRGEHLLVKRARCALGLDTSPYNGHVTTADLLWAGVPVLTLAPPGVGMVGRAAGSLLRAAGAPPAFFTAESLEAYADTAVRVFEAYAGAAEAAVGAAGDAAAAAGGGGGGGDALLWRPSPTAPLFDSLAWTRGFEATLRALFDEGREE